jgi:hypothetical protein
MRRIAFLVAPAALAVAFPLAAPAGAATQTYRGQATSVDPGFRYGKVTVKRSGARVTFVEIKAVTAYCAGQPLLRTIVFRPSMQVVSGSNRISRATMRITYRPVRSAESWTRLKIVFSGRRATGTFDETGLCTDRGRFTASR